MIERAPNAQAIAAHFDALLGTAETPDYPNAVNGLQVANSGRPVTRIAAAVDASTRTIEAAATAGANLLIVHHGLFWSGLQPVRGAVYDRFHTLFDRDIAVYAAHLPLDRHPTLGNNALLARALDLLPTDGFAQFQSIAIGVRGEAERPTAGLVAAADAFASRWKGRARASAFEPERVTRQWAICTGAGADASTLAEAEAAGIDTLIVGEGPHWTAVQAPERGLVIIYAGHYATETLGVQALAGVAQATFGIPWTFIDAPTGL
jgi:dinuclear metal center YbgI/SA1388 family protein